LIVDRPGVDEIPPDAEVDIDPTVAGPLGQTDGVVQKHLGVAGVDAERRKRG
jgi:hypothetical protein